MANVRSQDMLLLQDQFTNLKQKQDEHATLKTIKRILSRTFDLDFSIAVIDNDTNKFFGMSIYPESSLVEKMISEIIENRATTGMLNELWSKNKKWYLEIDSILLYDMKLNANPAEIVAILLHEIGHIVYSNTIPLRVNKIMRYKLMKSSLKLKKIVQWEKAQRLFDLVIVEACGSKNYHFVNMHHERMADRYVVKMGYGDALDSFVDKLINTQGNSLVNRTEESMDRDVKAVVTWMIINVHELEFRKSKLQRTLQAEVIRNPSVYARNMIKTIKSKFFGGEVVKTSYEQLLTEQYLIQEYTSVTEGWAKSLFDKTGKIKKIGQIDIDVISVELERINTTDDKLYVLDLIYDKLDIINLSLDMISQKQTERVSMSKDKLVSFKDQLEKLRVSALKTPVNIKDYGLFIKYPKGYEG